MRFIQMIDLKTILTTGIVMISVIIYLLFFYPSKESTTTDLDNEDGYKITPDYAMKLTGNDLIPVEYISTNDGDTFRVKVNGKEKRVRLLMVDTPEMNYEDQNPMPYAEEAKDFTSSLLENASKIEILFDIGDETDHYGRLLSYVFVDGVLLQEALIKEGYAAVRFIYEPNNTLEEDLKEIQQVAENKKINIWENENYLQNDGYHPEIIQQ
ncbi:thermonuclease family protein [Ureibacillus composti]|nr:thermonuclease family protein [Ureibacillus composti]